MKAQRKGSNMLVEARLRAYDDAVRAGKSREEAMTIAKAVTRRDLGPIRKPKPATIVVFRQCPTFWTYELIREDGSTLYETSFGFVSPDRAEAHAREWCEKRKIPVTNGAQS